MFTRKAKLKRMISSPTSFQHFVHVSHDSLSDSLMGLPPQWSGLTYRSFGRPIVNDPCEMSPALIQRMKEMSIVGRSDDRHIQPDKVSTLQLTPRSASSANLPLYCATCCHSPVQGSEFASRAADCTAYKMNAHFKACSTACGIQVSSEHACTLSKSRRQTSLLVQRSRPVTSSTMRDTGNESSTKFTTCLVCPMATSELDSCDAAPKCSATIDNSRRFRKFKMTAMRGDAWKADSTPPQTPTKECSCAKASVRCVDSTGPSQLNPNANAFMRELQPEPFVCSDQTSASCGDQTKQTLPLAQPSTEKVRLASSSDRSSSSELLHGKFASFCSTLRELCSKVDRRVSLFGWRKLAEGSSATVYTAIDTERRWRVAVKVFELHEQRRYDLLLNEVMVMSKLKHPNLVQMHDAHLIGERGDPDQLWIVMEYLSGGTLAHLIQHCDLKEKHMATICCGVLRGLAYLHSNGVVHRDVRSDSVLFDLNGRVKLGDFGLCDCSGRGHMGVGKTRSSLIGVPYWIAPEVIARLPYGTAADMWSFGVTLFEMVHKQPPYFDLSPVNAMYRIRNGPAPVLVHCSLIMRDFAARVLTFQPCNRATAYDLLEDNFIKRLADSSNCLIPLIKAVHNSSEV